MKRNRSRYLGGFTLTDEQYGEIAVNTFELLEHFAVEMLPALWNRESTMLQVQISSLVFARQLRGVPLTVADLSRELGLPRSSVQYTVDKLQEQGTLTVEFDEEDRRKRYLKIPVAEASRLGDFETHLLRYRIHWHRQLADILDRTRGEEGAKDSRTEPRPAVLRG